MLIEGKGRQKTVYGAGKEIFIRVVEQKSKHSNF